MAIDLSSFSRDQNTALAQFKDQFGRAPTSSEIGSWQSLGASSSVAAAASPAAAPVDHHVTADGHHDQLAFTDHAHIGVATDAAPDAGAAAAIEGSKTFSKELMKKYNIPTAFFKVCTELEEAKAFVRKQGAPIVIKADGLAAGKGVVVAMQEKEALDALDEIMGKHKFGAAGASVVIEEFMDGEEASLFAFTDGKTIVPMVAAQDHKRVNDDDKGPNTGGMGAYAPAPVLTEALKEKCMETIIRPTLAAMAKEGRPYSGCLYTGLMIKGDSAKVVEFNCRFGDPETQAVLPLLDGDLAEIMMACATGTLRPEMVKWSNKAAVCVVMASGGYPGTYKKGLPITGIQEADALQDVVVFHAGTKTVDGRIVTNGGRVLGVTAIGNNIPQAKEKAYAAVERIHFADAHYRSDIAWRALKRLKNSH